MISDAVFFIKSSLEEAVTAANLPLAWLYGTKRRPDNNQGDMEILDDGTRKGKLSII